MDTALQSFFSFEFLLFGLAISAFTYVITTLVTSLPNKYNAKNNKIWSEFVLPILPIMVGAIGAFFAKKYPFPEALTSASGRIAFGLVAGLVSSQTWRLVKAMITSKITALTSTTIVTTTEQISDNGGAAAGKVDDTENK